MNEWREFYRQRFREDPHPSEAEVLDEAWRLLCPHISDPLFQLNLMQVRMMRQLTDDNQSYMQRQQTIIADTDMLAARNVDQSSKAAVRMLKLAREFEEHAQRLAEKPRKRKPAFTAWK